MCNNFPNIRITEGNNFSLVLPLRSRTYVATKPIDEDIDPALLQNIVVTFGGVEYQAQITENGVQIDLPATLAVGTYNILLTADYLESSIRAAYESAVTIVPWSAQSTAEQYIAGSPIVLSAAYVLSGALTDAELEELKEEWREKNAQLAQAIEDAEQAKAEWERKAEELDGVAQEQTSRQILMAVENIDTRDLAKQDTLLEVKQATNDTIASQQTTISAQSARILAFDGEVADAYDYLEGEGAVMPQDKTIENLPATIEQVVGAVTDMRVVSIAIEPTAQFVDVRHIVVVENNIFGNVRNNFNIHSWKGYRVPGLLNASNQFAGCVYLTQLDFTESDTSNLTNISLMFYRCSALQSLDLSSFNTANVTNMGQMFQECSALQSLDLSSFNAANVTNILHMFNLCNSLQSLVGDRIYEDIVANDIRVFDGININVNCNLPTTQIDRASIRAIINGLADRTGQSALTLTIGATLLTKLSAEDIAVATNKNWTIA